ncbi:hypothetical protein RFI_08933 [Reticulomyxa filosa]|uniref:Uncharacterized protein n=1 Tax=Reticulomyxa filosa TaxID=46433 RepID=X6NR44_RETFI|nr:hypothetical protein RFI_08933 [Reticulomyxa filosa]|eukprot:ETO28199.1 hypothetical protein RFI_08933 [Reticulomyxa filosa]
MQQLWEVSFCFKRNLNRKNKDWDCGFISIQNGNQVKLFDKKRNEIHTSKDDGQITSRLKAGNSFELGDYFVEIQNIYTMSIVPDENISNQQQRKGFKPPKLVPAALKSNGTMGISNGLNNKACALSEQNKKHGTFVYFVCKDRLPFRMDVPNYFNGNTTNDILVMNNTNNRNNCKNTLPIANGNKNASDRFYSRSALLLPDNLPTEQTTTKISQKLTGTILDYVPERMESENRDDTIRNKYELLNGLKKIVAEKKQQKNLSNDKPCIPPVFLSPEMLYLPINHSQVQIKTWVCDSNVLETNKPPQRSHFPDETKQETLPSHNRNAQKVSTLKLPQNKPQQVTSPNFDNPTEEHDNCQFLLTTDK